MKLNIKVLKDSLKEINNENYQTINYATCFSFIVFS